MPSFTETFGQGKAFYCPGFKIMSQLPSHGSWLEELFLCLDVLTLPGETSYALTF